jgi:hypothetical protein
MSARQKSTLETLRTLALALPGVEEGTSYGTLAFKVKKKLLVRVREDGETLVVICGFDERDLRMQQQPTVFFNEPHYYGYPAVLVRLGRVSARDLREVIEVAWRRAAPKGLLLALRQQRP